MLVYGYIKIEISFLEIPLDIVNLVNAFLIFADKWTISPEYRSNNVIINQDENTITSLGTGIGTTYGEAIVDAASGVQTWKFKVLNLAGSSYWFCVIGIVENDDEWLKRQINKPTWYRQHKGYGFCGGRGKLISAVQRDNIWNDYGEKFNKQDDTLEMMLNVKDGTLKYIINGTDYDNAFVDIDTTKQYRLAVSLSRLAKDTVIKLY